MYHFMSKVTVNAAKKVSLVARSLGPLHALTGAHETIIVYELNHLSTYYAVF